MKDDSIIKEKPKGKAGRKKSLQSRMIFFLVIIFVIIIAVPYYFITSALREDEHLLRSYRYATVNSRTFVRNITAGGVVKPGQVISINSEVTGSVARIYHQAGEDIAQGELLAVIDAPTLQDEIEEVVRQISQIEFELEEMKINQRLDRQSNILTLSDLEDKLLEAQQDLDLQEKLHQLGMVSDNTLAAARKNASRAEIELASRQEQLKLAEKKTQMAIDAKNDRLQETRENHLLLKEKLDNREITAPISGRLLRVDVREGDHLQEGSVILEMVDLRDSIVELDLPETSVVAINHGQEAQIRVSGNTVTGTVIYISPEIKSSSDGPVVEVQLSLDRIPENLRVNASASVVFEIQRREGIPYLPRDDYLTSGEYSFVYLLDNDKAIRTETAFGQHDGAFIEVLSGLEEGDQVIVSSYQEFKERREISVIPDGGRKVN